MANYNLLQASLKKLTKPTEGYEGNFRDTSQMFSNKKSELDKIDSKRLNSEPDQVRHDFDEIKEAEVEEESNLSSYCMPKMGKTI